MDSLSKQELISTITKQADQIKRYEARLRGKPSVNLQTFRKKVQQVILERHHMANASQHAF